MKLNGIEVPEFSGRGRAFPYKENGPHFVGPININGEIKVIKVWKNISDSGREYLRFIVETVEESQFKLEE